MTNDTYIFDNCNEAYLKIAKELIYKPHYLSSPRKQETYELINTTIVIKNPYDRLVRNKYRNLSLKYLVGEFLWYERGSNLLDEISYYSSFWKKISDDGITCNSSYGKRIYSSDNKNDSQWKYIKNVLTQDKSSRRAVMFVGNRNDSTISTKDFPCTLNLQFLIREDELHLITHMRSNDLFLGFCYDIAIFTLWQEKMLIELRQFYPNLKLGNYFHNVGSLHIYQKNLDIVKKSIEFPNENMTNPLFKIPKMDNFSELGYVFKIEEIIRTKNSTFNNQQIIGDDFCKWLIQVLQS